MSKKVLLQKLICLVVALALGAIAGVGFYDQRHFKETVVVSEALTDVMWLSDYCPELKGTFGDTPIFVFDSGVEGGSLLVCGGTHPYEPACSVATYVMMENIKVDQGVVYIIPQANMSASTTGVQGNAYPPYMHVETEWGQAVYKIGERRRLCEGRWVLINTPIFFWKDIDIWLYMLTEEVDFNEVEMDISNLEKGHFERTEKAANYLLKLVLAGKKKATSSSLWAYEIEGEAVPKVGDRCVITYWDGTPGCIIETTNVRIIPYADMTYEIARLEGEDDTLASWQKTHQHFFTEEGKELGYTFSENMPVVFEEFKVIEVL